MAMELVARFHSDNAAAGARAWFEATFEGKGFPADAKVARFALGTETGISVARALKEAGLAKSNGDAGRLVSQDAVTINGAKIKDKDLRLAAGEYQVKVGKDRFVKIVVE